LIVDLGVDEAATDGAGMRRESGERAQEPAVPQVLLVNIGGLDAVVKQAKWFLTGETQVGAPNPVVLPVPPGVASHVPLRREVMVCVLVVDEAFEGGETRTREETEEATDVDADHGQHVDADRPPEEHERKRQARPDSRKEGGDADESAQFAREETVSREGRIPEPPTITSVRVQSR
jgi:hypothetical protein